MSTRIIDGEAFTIEQIAKRLGVVNATARIRLAQAKKALYVGCPESTCKEIRKTRFAMAHR